MHSTHVANPTQQHLQATLLTDVAGHFGIYEFQINGTRVGDDLLASGYPTYSKRVEILAYHVTPLIRDGDNAIGALLGNAKRRK